MKMHKIEIKNFRSLKEITIDPKDILALVGRNNSGKSNIIKALQLFFEASVKLVNEECYYNHVGTTPIEILITFEGLSEWEKEKFEPWMNGDNLVVGREISPDGSGSYEITNTAIINVPEPEWLQESEINGENITRWWSDKRQLIINGLDFSSDLGSSKPQVGKWKDAAAAFCAKYPDKIPIKAQKLINPKGYPGVLKGALPEFVFIPAVKDVTEEAKVTKTSPFGQLITSVMEKISLEQKDKLAKEIREIEKRLNRSEDGSRLEEIKEIETRLNTIMNELMDCDIEIEMPMPEIKDVFGSAKIYADDGVRTLIETKGHGMQRLMIFTILRTYALLTHSQKAGEKANQRSTIFAIEEPELYLHPQSQRTLMNVFRLISSGSDQIIYCTHSSLFVDIAHFDEICIMRREKTDGKWISHSTQLPMSLLIEDLKKRTGIEGSETSIREHYSHVFNPIINEGFFANKVVIVEGPSEQYSLPIYAHALGHDFDRDNISIVHSDGKGQIDKLLSIFVGFKIPSFVWFDGDKDNSDANVVKKSLELLAILNDPIKSASEIKTKVTDKYAILEFNLEKTLKEEIKEYEDLSSEATKILGPVGKPLKHRFMANHIKIEIDAGRRAKEFVPNTIRNIIIKINSLV